MLHKVAKAGFLILILIFVIAVGFLIYDLTDTENIGNNNSTLDITSNQITTQINAPSSSEYMVWYSTENDPFNSFKGRHSGRETLQFSRGNHITMYEISDNHYTADHRARYGGRIEQPIEHVEVQDTRLDYETVEITENITSEAEETNRITETDKNYIDYDVQVIGDEQQVEIEIRPENDYYQPTHLFWKELGNVGLEVESVAGHTEIEGAEPLENEIQIGNETFNKYSKGVKWDKELLDETESLSVVLKVVKQNDDLKGFDEAEINQSDALFLMFKDSDYHATIEGAGFGHENSFGEDIGFQENTSQPYGKNEGISLETR